MAGKEMRRSSSGDVKQWTPVVSQWISTIDRTILTTSAVIVFQHLSVVEPLWTLHKEITFETSTYNETIREISASMRDLEQHALGACPPSGASCSGTTRKAEFLAGGSLEDVDRYLSLEDLAADLREKRTSLAEGSEIEFLGFKIPLLKVLFPTINIIFLFSVVLWLILHRNSVLEKIEGEVLSGPRPSAARTARGVIPGRWWMAAVTGPRRRSAMGRSYIPRLLLTVDLTKRRYARFALTNLLVCIAILVLLARGWWICHEILTQNPVLETQKPIEAYLQIIAFVSNLFALLTVPLVVLLGSATAPLFIVNSPVSGKLALGRRAALAGGLAVIAIPPYLLSGQETKNSISSPRSAKRNPPTNTKLANNSPLLKHKYILDGETRKLYPIVGSYVLGISATLSHGRFSAVDLSDEDLSSSKIGDQNFSFSGRWDAFSIEREALDRVESGNSHDAIVVLLRWISNLPRDTEKPGFPWPRRATRVLFLCAVLLARTLKPESVQAELDRYLDRDLSKYVLGLQTTNDSSRGRRIQSPDQPILWKTPIPLSSALRATLIPFGRDKLG